MIDHRKAQRQNIAAQYVLDELTANQREEFEHHYFDCSECAAEVRALTAITGARALLAEVPGRMAAEGRRRRNFAWFEMFTIWRPRPAYAMAPLCMLLALTGFTTYEWASLRGHTVGQAIACFTLRPVARGAETPVETGNGAFFVLNADVPGLASDLHWQVRREDSGAVVIQGVAPSLPLGTSLSLLVPSAKFRSGSYVLSIRQAAAGSPLPTTVAYRFRMH